ncbi:hypothetical protein [Streptomyces sp. TLI_185]|uniref:hypothetical protein n=1 Tax=Streptomyces sp. TLI_185 TaxID=2485151 RepID=UPI000FBC545A|nr:hypothetical protein [Streptomyces sp. TLI_185]RPF30432.1 hypothetical protein EDD92_0203 [Streptomyces sp. TLI_185]
MRFGRCVWQRTENGARRHHLELVADEGAPATPLSAFALAGQPRLDRTAERVMAHADALARLLEEMHARGVLSESALQAVNAAARPRALTHAEERELSRTDRLSDYWR